VLIGALAACSGSEPAAKPEPVAATPREQAPPTCPLTGKAPPRTRVLHRPAVAIKVENSTEARPQSGLEDADVVFEEIVEGGITRFMAIFHCGDSDRVGPVRSARFDDPKIAKPFTRVLGFSGANGIVERELHKRKMIALNELNTSGGFYRVPPGNRDIHSLYADVSKVRAQATTTTKKKKKLQPPHSVFRFGPLPKEARGAHKASLHFNASNEIGYRYRRGVWKRWEGGQRFMSRTGGQIGPTNVLVLQVEVNNSKSIVDPAGNPSPDIALLGSGKAWLLRDGKVIRGRWKIPRAGAPPVLRTRRGHPFTFAKGSTWVELVPSSKGDVKGSVTIH
jgi:hypothetical protein